MDNSPSTYYHSAYVSKFNVEKRDADTHWQTTLSLSPDKLLAEARQTASLTDFGSDEFLSPMQILLDSADSEGDLNPFGRFAIRSHTLRALKNRLWAQAYFDKYPEIKKRKIVAPIIIIGPHRSGTTRLQRMIASDNRLQHLRAWEGINPAPRLDCADLGASIRHGEVKKMLDGRKHMYPNAYLAHPMDADWAEEEMLLLNQSFSGFLPLGFYHVPDYYQWFLGADKRFAYDYMADLMRLISTVRGDAKDKRWVLKNPQHMLDLDTLMKTFPDARLIFTHRDPIKTVGSVLSLMWSYAAQHTDAPCRIKTRKTWMDFAEQMARRSIEARKKIHPGQQLDVYYHDMNQDWQAVMKRIYDFADLELTPTAKDAMTAWLKESEAKQHHVAHRYSMEDFGLTAQEVDARMGFMRQEYGIPHEKA
jgi:hypothetical protein